MRSNDGIALIMVMGVIAILTFLLAEFTFETKLNKIKVYNQQDKIQARLNAEAGLNLAMARLRLYQEGRNRIEKEENLKNTFPSSDLESILIQPFVFPIPVGRKANIIQRNAVEEFLAKTILRGELSVTVSKISGFLNPNIMRTPPKTKAEEEAEIKAYNDQQNSKSSPQDQNQKEKKPGEAASVVMEKKLIETLQRLIKDKNDTDESFHAKYANADAQYLIKELKFYLTNNNDFNDSSRPEIEAKFSQKGILVKHAPISSIDELYQLPSWDDDLVDLIKDRLCVHEVSIIPVNEITLEDLKTLFPSINNIQIEEFFKYRDGDEDKKIKGKKFKNADDFKRVVVSELNIVSDTEYNDRIESFKNAGLVIDTSGKLYKVTSRGSMNNSTYNLVAYIDVPSKSSPKKNTNSNRPLDPQDNGEAQTDNLDDGSIKEPPKSGQKEKDPPTELLQPRVVEIRVE